MECFLESIVKEVHYRGHNITAIIMGLNGSAAHPRASQALSSMLARNALNPADITILYKLYSTQEPPPVELIRIPQFMGPHRRRLSFFFLSFDLFWKFKWVSITAKISPFF